MLSKVSIPEKELLNGVLENMIRAKALGSLGVALSWPPRLSSNEGLSNNRQHDREARGMWSTEWLAGRLKPLPGTPLNLLHLPTSDTMQSALDPESNGLPIFSPRTLGNSWLHLHLHLQLLENFPFSRFETHLADLCPRSYQNQISEALGFLGMIPGVQFFFNSAFSFLS